MTAHSAYCEWVHELRLVVEAIRDRVDSTDFWEGRDVSPENSCGLCPICALIALIKREQHEIMGFIAHHGLTLLTVIRALLAGNEEVHGDRHKSESQDYSGRSADESAEPRKYQPINVRLGP